jgi:hypothetical protein
MAPPVATPLTEADLDAAFARGLAAGETSGAASAARTAVYMEETAAAVAGSLANEAHARQRDRAVLRRDIAAFLNAFCGRLAARQAAPLALSLADRLLAGSSDEAGATLFVSEETFAEFGEDLRRALSEKPGAASIELGSDGALIGGECRLQWRGGAARYDNAVVAAEIDRILAAARADDTEDSHE